MKAHRMIVFSTDAVQGTLAGTFFDAFADRVYLEGMSLSDHNMVSLLDKSDITTRHTPIWYFSRSTVDSGLCLRVFQWTHPTTQPHGEQVSPQCPGCGALAWQKSIEGSGGAITLRCENQGCKFERVYQRPEGCTRLKSSDGGMWTSRVITM